MDTLMAPDLPDLQRFILEAEAYAHATFGELTHLANQAERLEPMSSDSMSTDTISRTVEQVRGHIKESLRELGVGITAMTNLYHELDAGVRGW
ncbi:hypothetical protein OHT57_34025 [Streptomyces sp. NBC_00285]|uniref:hypothetical protein n=1 Tax=Streptomyces sp. NBC_00285 TaxID=2975700 RepID=UPI002E2E65EC|nr:hypothetical protein [Streptomyces sp. NBC_00285]